MPALRHVLAQLKLAVDIINQQAQFNEQSDCCYQLGITVAQRTETSTVAQRASR